MLFVGSNTPWLPNYMAGITTIQLHADWTPWLAVAVLELMPLSATTVADITQRLTCTGRCNVTSVEALISAR